jgi:hypothetical protein
MFGLPRIQTGGIRFGELNMSNHLISQAYRRDLRTVMRKAVMVLFADKASDDGSGIYASKQTMADELCCSKQSVIDTIKGLLSDGLVREVGQRRNSNGFTVEYGIQVDALRALPLVACHAKHRSAKLTGQPAGPVNDIDPTSQPAGPDQSTRLTQTLIEPPLNPEAKASVKARARSSQPTESAVEIWNERARSAGWPSCQKVSDAREKQLAARLREHGLVGWRSAMDRAAASPFLASDEPPSWFVFDWLIKAANFQKLIEGNYDRAGGNNYSRGSQSDGFDQACRRLANRAPAFRDPVFQAMYEGTL